MARIQRQQLPDVLAQGHQVLVHVGYTASMPPTLGEFFYKCGGRVTVEIDHAHGPIVARFVAWWPWKDRDEQKVQRSIEHVLEELSGADSALPV